jgi:hypothetical protein
MSTNSSAMLVVTVPFGQLIFIQDRRGKGREDTLNARPAKGFAAERETNIPE